MSRQIFTAVFCLIFGFGPVCFAQDQNQEILADMQRQLPENTEIIYAGRYAENYYVFYRSVDSHACAKPRLKVGNNHKQLKDAAVHDIICNHGMSTIIKTAEGAFYFPAAWQRQGGQKAAFDGKISLRELKFLEEGKND